MIILICVAAVCVTALLIAWGKVLLPLIFDILVSFLLATEAGCWLIDRGVGDWCLEVLLVIFFVAIRLFKSYLKKQKEVKK